MVLRSWAGAHTGSHVGGRGVHASLSPRDHGRPRGSAPAGRQARQTGSPVARRCQPIQWNRAMAEVSELRRVRMTRSVSCEIGWLQVGTWSKNPRRSSWETRSDSVRANQAEAAERGVTDDRSVQACAGEHEICQALVFPSLFPNVPIGMHESRPRHACLSAGAMAPGSIAERC
mgnify:CR=1 FL=1